LFLRRPGNFGFEGYTSLALLKGGIIEYSRWGYWNTQGGIIEYSKCWNGISLKEGIAFSGATGKVDADKAPASANAGNGVWRGTRAI
jgi:hypothetical protein